MSANYVASSTMTCEVTRNSSGVRGVGIPASIQKQSFREVNDENLAFDYIGNALLLDFRARYFDRPRGGMRSVTWQATVGRPNY